MLRFKNYKNEKSFELLGGIFCDGIIITKLKELFATQREMQIYLGSKGLCIQSISPAAIKDCYYVRFEDSQNEFTEEFIKKLIII